MAEVLTEEETQEETSESKEEEVAILSEFQILKQTYEKVCAQIEKEGKINFAHEYTRIFNAFRKAYMHEEEFSEEIKALKAQVETSISNVASAERLAAVDKEEIDKLGHEINEAWKMVDSSHTREENSQQEIESLGQQIDRLNKELEHRDRLALGTLEEFHGDAKGKDNLFRERERLIHEVEMLRERLANALTVQEDLERKSSAAEQRCNELTQELEYQTNEMYKEVHAKERLEEELKAKSANLERKESEVTNLKLQLGQAQLNTGKLETSAKDLKALNERLQKDVESLNSRLNKMQVDSKLQAETLETLINEKSTKIYELKMKEEEITRLRSEAAKVDKMREHYVQKLTQTEKQCASLEQETKKLEGVIGQLRKDLDMAKKYAESEKKALHDLQRDNKVLNRKILKASGAAYEQEKYVKMQEQEKINLEKEINSFKFEANKQRKLVACLDKDRDRYIHESQQWAQKLQDMLDEVKLKEAAIFDYEKKISEADTKIHMQQKCFEALESDKITLEKMLREAQDEIPELKQKLKTMGQEIEQLKDDITTKETQLLKQKHVLEESDKEKKNLKIELTNLKDELHECKEQIKTLTLEEKKLQKVIQDAVEDKEKQKKVVEQIMNERDILGAQFVRKNNELSSLYEKLNILQSTLHEGEAQYDQRLEDIRLLKLEIRRDRQEKTLLSRSVTYMTDMRQEIFHLEQDLTREKLKCRALEEELQTPLNIHRWRKLEGSDPSKYELIQKVRLLQKRLLAQAETAIKQEDQLQQLEFQCSSLREMLARQPGPEVAVQLKTAQDALKARDKKIKCLVSESIMYKEQVTELRSELERVKDESQGVKEKYYAQKRRLQIMKERERQLTSNFTLPTLNSGRTYFVGGGFNLSTRPRNMS